MAEDLFALDFDGVLCDSAVECAVTAWRAGGQIWPEWKGAEPPDWARDRFVELRPVIETGFQTVLLMRMICDRTDATQITLNFAAACEDLLEVHRLQRKELVSLFGSTRDRWIEDDLDDWLSRHRFYPGVLEKVAEVSARARIMILTTKQERFVEQLLKSRGVDFPREQIYGLDRGRSKEEILVELHEDRRFRNVTFHFVEDRLDTLLRVLEHGELNNVRLYLVDWGYNTVAERAKAAEQPRITICSQARFMLLS